MMLVNSKNRVAVVVCIPKNVRTGMLDFRGKGEGKALRGGSGLPAHHAAV